MGALQINLPIELVLCVVEALAPHSAVAIHPSCSTARAIKACLTVCRATYPVALRLLYTHCLYIDSSERLRKLLLSIDRHEVYRLDPEAAVVAHNLRASATIPTINILPCLQNLYLSPFPLDTIDDLPTAHWIFELFSTTRHTLRRLVVDIPFHSLNPERDHLDVLPKLRAGFSELVSLEEFVCLRDDLSLAAPLHWSTNPLDRNVPMWSKWKNLRRLGLSDVDLMRDDFMHLQGLPLLETIAPLHVTPSYQQNFALLFGQLSRNREHETRVICPARQGRVRLPIQQSHAYIPKWSSWAREWNDVCELKSLSDMWTDEPDSDDEDMADEPPEETKIKNQVHLDTVLVDGYYQGDTWGRESLRMWMKDRALEGSLWEPERHSASFVRDRVDPDLWYDKSIEFVESDSSQDEPFAMGLGF